MIEGRVSRDEPTSHNDSDVSKVRLEFDKTYSLVEGKLGWAVHSSCEVSCEVIKHASDNLYVADTFQERYEPFCAGAKSAH